MVKNEENHVISFIAFDFLFANIICFGDMFWRQNILVLWDNNISHVFAQKRLAAFKTSNISHVLAQKRLAVFKTSNISHMLTLKICFGQYDTWHVLVPEHAKLSKQKKIGCVGAKINSVSAINNIFAVPASKRAKFSGCSILNFFWRRNMCNVLKADVKICWRAKHTNLGWLWNYFTCFGTDGTPHDNMFHMLPNLQSKIAIIFGIFSCIYENSLMCRTKRY